MNINLVVRPINYIHIIWLATEEHLYLNSNIIISLMGCINNSLNNYSDWVCATISLKY